MQRNYQGRIEGSTRWEEFTKTGLPDHQPVCARCGIRVTENSGRGGGIKMCRDCRESKDGQWFAKQIAKTA